MKHMENKLHMYEMNSLKQEEERSWMLNSLSIFLSSEILSYLLRHFDAKCEIPWTCFHCMM